MAIPFLYRVFYLYIEPLSALGGAIYAALLPKEYLNDLLPYNALPTFTSSALIPSPVIMTLAQLANLYLLFAINEHFVLSSTNDVRIWKRVLFGLLVADFGHLWSVKDAGMEVYWRVWEWNPMMRGSVGFVYLGAMSRICFLLGIGLGEGMRKAKKN